ncbi:MAG TPA: DUF4835 family protein [Sphingobacteriaceae bacterium]|nr:DUF4835 family protein [Sphingobacteriaceae bacterium]
MGNLKQIWVKYVGIILFGAIFFFMLIGFGQPAQAQELNARVEILSPQLPHTNKRVLDVLQRVMTDFLNKRSWTGQQIRPNERIDCNFVITINTWDGVSEFTGQAQIMSMRPVYNANYSSPILNTVDKDFDFSYVDGQIIEYSDQQFTNNLTSLLAYYANLIIGMDADTFSPDGGTPYYNVANSIVNNAQSSSYAGWRFMDGDANRYWLVNNMQDRRFYPIRKFLYEYSRHGLDQLAENPVQARQSILQSMELLKSVDRMGQKAMLPQIFFTAKSNELVGVLSALNPQERVQIFNLLNEIDPSNSRIYEVLRSR